MKAVPLLCVLAVSLAAQEAKRPAPGDVLQIASVTPDAASGRVFVNLVNVGNKTVTAYRLAVSGNRAATVGEEFFPSIGMGPGMGVGGIPPRQTRQFTLAGVAQGNPEVKVAALVFEDDTAMGDEVEIARVFTRRNAEATEMGAWCGVMRNATFAEELRSDPRSALLGLAARAARSDDVKETDPIRKAGIMRVRRELVSEWQQGSGLDDPSRVVSFRLERCSAAAQHSLRKEVAK
jgi:hypothetical protein